MDDFNSQDTQMSQKRIELTKHPKKTCDSVRLSYSDISLQHVHTFPLATSIMMGLPGMFDGSFDIWMGWVWIVWMGW